MKRSDKTALAIGAVGTWIYIGGVDSDLWGRAALGAGMFLLALAGKKIGDYVDACREEQEVRAAAEAGAVFAVMKQPRKEPETKEEVKPTPPPEKPCWTGQEEEAGHWKDDGASKRRMVL